MEHDPSTARIASSRLGRLRALRTRSMRVADDGAVPPEAVAVEAGAPGRAKGLDDVPALASVLTRHGHVVRVSDRTEPGELSPAAGLRGYLVLEDVVGVLARRAASDQRVHLRMRVEAGELIVAVQTLPEGPRSTPFTIAPRDEAALRRRIEGAKGRATIRTTHGGNWLAMARLPL
jgi:hypothetical protein